MKNAVIRGVSPLAGFFLGLIGACIVYYFEEGSNKYYALAPLIGVTLLGFLIGHALHRNLESKEHLIAEAKQQLIFNEHPDSELENSDSGPENQRPEGEPEEGAAPAQ